MVPLRTLQVSDMVGKVFPSNSEQKRILQSGRMLIWYRRLHVSAVLLIHLSDLLVHLIDGCFHSLGR